MFILKTWKSKERRKGPANETLPEEEKKGKLISSWHLAGVIVLGLEELGDLLDEAS